MAARRGKGKEGRFQFHDVSMYPEVGQIVVNRQRSIADLGQVDLQGYNPGLPSLY